MNCRKRKLLLWGNLYRGIFLISLKLVEIGISRFPHIFCCSIWVKPEREKIIPFWLDSFFPFTLPYSILEIARHIPYCNNMHFFLFPYQMVDNAFLTNN